MSIILVFLKFRFSPTTEYDNSEIISDNDNSDQLKLIMSAMKQYEDVKATENNYSDNNPIDTEHSVNLGIKV